MKKSGAGLLTLGDVIRHSAAGFSGEVGTGFGEGGAKPGKTAEEIWRDKDLTVCAHTCPNANGGSFHPTGYLICDFGDDALQHDGEGSGFIERDGIRDQKICLLGCLALFFVAAFFPDTLGQHADVSDKRDACLNDGPHLRDKGGSAFQLYSICTSFDEAARVHQSLSRCVITVRRQVTDDRRTSNTTADGGDMVSHHFHGHSGGVRQAQDHHAQRIANEEQVSASLIQQSCYWIVISSEYGERWAVFFPVW